MSDPISYAVAAEMFQIAAAMEKSSNSAGWTCMPESHLESRDAIRIAIDAGLVESVGWNLVYPALRLTERGLEMVQEGIAAMREVS